MKASAIAGRLRLVKVIGWPGRKRLALGHLERPGLSSKRGVGPIGVVTAQEVVHRARVG